MGSGRSYEIDRAIEHIPPDSIDLGPLAQGGRAPREAGQADEVVRVEHQVLRARFGGDTDSALFRLPDQGQRPAEAT